MSNKMKKIEASNATFMLDIPDDLPSFYIDGLSAFALSDPVCKVLLTSVDPVRAERDKETGETLEYRRGECLLTVPHNALAEICKIILRQLQSSSEFLVGESSTRAALLKASLSTITIDENPAAPKEK